MLRNLSVFELYRPYSPKEYKGESGWVWNGFNPQEAFRKLEFVYTSLPKAYDEFLKSFFPLLYEDLKFYSSFNLLIVNVSYKSVFETELDCPSVDLFHLHSEEHATESVKMYLNYNECPIRPDNKYDAFTNGVLIDGLRYKLKQSIGSQIHFLYEKYTLQNTLYDMLERRFKSYFKTKTS
jgi:hypothetical protein